MARAIVSTTAFKTSTSGGTFADALAAVSGDSLNVAVFQSGGARILEMWGINSLHVGELSFVYTRPDATHDQSRGVRFSMASAVPGGVGTVGAHMLLGGYGAIPVYPGDTATLNVTSTASDAVVVSYTIEYDNFPGADAQFATWEQVQAARRSTFGNRVSAVASGTAGALGTARALTADDNRFHAGSWYAMLGLTVQTQVSTVYLSGPELGGQRIGVPAGVGNLDQTAYFVDQSKKWNKPMIPVFQGLNAPNWNVYVIDSAASTSPQIDFLYYELNGPLGS